MQTNLASNLYYLCGFYPSVSHVCRTVGINRTQFNRYLAARARPSRHMLSRLCDFFGVEAIEIHLPPDQFQKLISLRKRVHPEPAPYVEQINALQRFSRPDMRKYLGYYHEYYHSMSSPGQVIRGIVHVFEHQGNVYFRKIEHIQGGSRQRVSYKFRYTGAAFFLDDRIFMVDAESLTQNEITQMILFPTYKNKVGRLSGLILGVSSGDQRRIACSRFVMEWLGSDIDLRKAIRACGLFDPASGDVDAGILALIDNSTMEGSALFYAAAT
ncbi:helix-turn-helix domain-containing protein [Chthonobacter albigriseus]|uniref:helix-turn-helix domain-containing protein n=1 Tax=Chthonobacter albigriseus TaxID=1683161 RepID=UPI0015EED386|nr:helix-turn-helix transcriptional regulator [Chthonobacter albigriseus]